MDIETKKNEGFFSRLLLILLSVVFFFIPFTIGFNYYVTFLLSLLALIIVIYFNYKFIKTIDFLSLIVYFILITGIGVISAISLFSRQYEDIVTLILIPFTLTIFSFTGFILARGDKSLLKRILIGLLAGFLTISLINSIVTLVNFGFFYGFRFDSNYTYFDGSRSEYSVASSAYSLVGFSFKQVPVNVFLFYPSSLLIGIFFYLYNDRKSKYNIIFLIIISLVILFSFITVISRVSLLNIIFLIVVSSICALFILLPQLFNRISKIIFIVIGVLFLIFAALFILNSQANLVGFREFIHNNRLLNYLFNSNRYSASVSPVLNLFYSSDKLMGFPVSYDQLLDEWVYPSSNFIVNQIMFGGLFSFIFHVTLFGFSIYTTLELIKLKEDRFNKYLPLCSLIILTATLFIGDSGNISFYNNDFMALASVKNPLYLLLIMFISYQYSLVLGGKIDEA